MDSPLIPAVSARSAVLSLLLDAAPPTLSGRQIVAAMTTFGIAESTTRVALTRMVAAGDLVRSDARYSLSDRLTQRRLDNQPPALRPWNGTWEVSVITVTRRDAADRSALRAEMQRQRVAELREGVWTRPANLRRGWPRSIRQVSTCFEARPVDDPRELAERLWDLDAWSERGHRYLEAIGAAADEPTMFRTMIAAVRHLQSDPALPAELLPADWPAADLAAAYASYRTRLADTRAATS